MWLAEAAQVGAGEEPGGVPRGLVELAPVGDAPGAVAVEGTDDDPSPGSRDAGQLCDHDCGVGRELAHGDGDDDIEAVITEGEVVAVADDRWCRGASGGDGEHRRIWVQPVGVAFEVGREASGAAPDVGDALAGEVPGGGEDRLSLGGERVAAPR